MPISEYRVRNNSAMVFFDQSEEWSLLNFLKYLDSLKNLYDCSEAHRKYGIILNGMANDENVSQEKRSKAKLALLTFVGSIKIFSLSLLVYSLEKECSVESDNPAIELVGTLVLGRVRNTPRRVGAAPPDA